LLPQAAIRTDGEDAPLHYVLDRFSALRRNGALHTVKAVPSAQLPLHLLTKSSGLFELKPAAGRDESYERGTTDAKAGEAAEHLREIQELLLRLSTEETELVRLPPFLCSTHQCITCAAREHGCTYIKPLLSRETQCTPQEVPPNNATFDAAEESQQWVIAVEKALKDMVRVGALWPAA
jgi:hypothetical protein